MVKRKVRCFKPLYRKEYTVEERLKEDLENLRNAGMKKSGEAFVGLLLLLSY